ncbi:hypothetical protein [Nodosilinea sp. E11]|uniref:hypothetical protein n=1 Tax=Nodosilinea sp. E11 TaxID=3037479 RepID=UPI00293471C9|nr:hypothetical protein [Nodosilinea sp. E11]WOD37324.1 hypothetical protein RRF56_02375 [Nodosilinea sp. E11]
MKILIVAHIGETLGHLVRGISIAKELEKRGIEVSFAASDRAISLLKENFNLHVLSWNFSHNSFEPNNPTSETLKAILLSNKNLLELLETHRPNLIIGMPGIFTAQVALKIGIPHLSVMHGPYLSPLIPIKGFTESETKIIESTQQLFVSGCVDSIRRHLSKSLNLPYSTYQEYLETERIFVPQPNLFIQPADNIQLVNFINASLGEPFRGEERDLREACHITFGSGSCTDLTKIVHLARQFFPRLVVSCGTNKLEKVPDQVDVQPFISSFSLAGRVRAVISHGGIGTVGTFAASQTPQLIIPTDCDQANMTIYTRHTGIAHSVGKSGWEQTQQLGRCMPQFTDGELINSLEKLSFQSETNWKKLSSGASEIAESIVASF